MEWFFDGLGTEIISLIIGTVLGGTIGYKIGSKSKLVQKKSNNSKQVLNSINIGGNVTAKKNVKIGSINDEEK